MKHHFLPRFYLKGFTDPDADKEPEPYAWVYTLSKSEWKKRAPKNIATQNELYSYTDEKGGRNDDLEKILSLAEAQMAKLLTTRIQGRQQLDPQNLETMSYFLALMSTRLPGYLDQWSDFLAGIAKSTLDLLLSHPAAFEAERRRYEQETGKRLPEGFGSERVDLKNLKFVPKKPLVLMAALAPINMMASILFKMSWTFFTAPRDGGFVTSDYPFCAYNPDLEGSPYGPGLAHKRTTMTLPLSAQVAVLVSWGALTTGYREASRSEIKKFNVRTIRSAGEFIVSAKPSFVGYDLVLAHSRGRLRTT
ncbi:MAG: DUF4238 domain-containing protein [bacterium]|nr:DUF4238 domain-containing protein [bacterium]